MLTQFVAGRVYDYDHCIGGNFLWPCDFALGPGGSVYIAQRGFEFFGNHGLLKTSLDEEPVWENKGPLFGDGKCRFPSAIELDDDENIYVADDYVDRIFVFNKDGELLTSWGNNDEGEGEVAGLPGFGSGLYLKKLNGGSNGDGELNGPAGLAFDADGNLLVVDSYNHRIQKFTKDGQFISTFGSYGSGPGELNHPWGISVDKAQNIYVADWKNDRVQKFSPEGRHIASFGYGSGTDPGQLSRPANVAVDAEGDVYVVDWKNDRVNIYDTEGEFVISFSGDATELSKTSKSRVDVNPDYIKARKRADVSIEAFFRGPVAVKLDDDGFIYVLETIAPRIQIYQKHKDFVDAQFNL